MQNKMRCPAQDRQRQQLAKASLLTEIDALAAAHDALPDGDPGRGEILRRIEGLAQNHAPLPQR